MREHSEDKGHGHEQDPADAPAGGQVRHAETVLTVRAISGLSGDMMLAGLASLAGLGNDDLEALCAELRLPALRGALCIVDKSVNGIAGKGCSLSFPLEHAHRTLADVEGILAASAMPNEARELALSAFRLLAEAEGVVHGLKPSDVTFHEVGALDSILDVCLVCRLFMVIGPARFVCSPLPLADGFVRCAHGTVPAPAPAVVRMLEGVAVRGFEGEGETVTPTALALLKTLGASFGIWPAITVQHTVISYGTKVFHNAPNGSIWALGVAMRPSCSG